MRDELCKRAGGLCSRPDCRVPTLAARSGSEKSKSLGRACHIHAAAPGGPRYDPSQDRAQRSAIDNGIWLCANHAGDVDDDPIRFPAALLRAWKKEAEEYSNAILGKNVATTDLTRSGWIALGPEVIAVGKVVGSSAGVWTLDLGSFVRGDVMTLRSFADTFSRYPPEDRYVCVQTEGTGRVLLEAPSIDQTSGMLRVVLHVATPAPRLDANDLGRDFPMEFSGDGSVSPSWNEEIQGIGRVRGLVFVYLDTAKGTNLPSRPHGSRIAQLCEAMGRDCLADIVAIEAIRLATVSITEFNDAEVPLCFVDRVWGARVVAPSSLSSDVIHVELTLSVHGAAKPLEYEVPIRVTLPPPQPSPSELLEARWRQP